MKKKIFTALCVVSLVLVSAIFFAENYASAQTPKEQPTQMNSEKQNEGSDIQKPLQKPEDKMDKTGPSPKDESIKKLPEKKDKIKDTKKETPKY